MQKFSTLKSIPAYLPIVNIDTDMIIPKQFLKTIKRTGLGKSLFFEMRYDDKGKEIGDFVLNNSPFNNWKKFWLWFLKRTCSVGIIGFWYNMRHKLKFCRYFL